MRSAIRQITFGLFLLTVSSTGSHALSAGTEIVADAPPPASTEIDNYEESRDQGSTQIAPAVPAPEWPVSCERAMSDLDVSLIEMLKLKDSYLIVIARLGTGEHSNRLNRYRLEGVEEYMKRKLPDVKYVLAEGKRVKGLGRVELYVGGKLLRTMPIKKNAKGYCEEPVDF